MLNTETLYIETKALIQSEAYNAYRKYGVGDFDDYLSSADELFMKAVKSFRKNKKTQFTTWLVIKLRGGFADDYRQNRKIKTLGDLENIENLEPSHNHNNINILCLMSELSQDARIMANLILDMPMNLQKLLLKKGNVKPRFTRGALKKYVKKEMGWKTIHTENTFKEIQNKL